jgi:hypothetical protein
VLSEDSLDAALCLGFVFHLIEVLDYEIRHVVG